MKWPNSLTFIRHGESHYNFLKLQKSNDADYLKFREIFDRDFAIAEDENWPSEELKTLARKIWQKTKLAVSDYDTPLTKNGFDQARKTGQELSKVALIPDVIYVSPYLRTRQTLDAIKQGWPGLADIKTVSEERVREQEHGVATVFNDWRVHYVLEPLQGLLYKLEGDYEYRFSNGENKADVRDRVRSFLSTLIRERAGQNVFVVSHHLTLLCLRANLERWDREQFMETDKFNKPINCGVTVYRGNTDFGSDGKLVMDIYNKKLY